MKSLLLENFELYELSVYADIQLFGIEFVKPEDFRDYWDYDWEIKCVKFVDEDQTSFILKDSEEIKSLFAEFGITDAQIVEKLDRIDLS